MEATEMEVFVPWEIFTDVFIELGDFDIDCDCGERIQAINYKGEVKING